MTSPSRDAVVRAVAGPHAEALALAVLPIQDGPVSEVTPSGREVVGRPRGRL
jgi:hypothetical protein